MLVYFSIFVSMLVNFLVVLTAWFQPAWINPFAAALVAAFFAAVPAMAFAYTQPQEAAR